MPLPKHEDLQLSEAQPTPDQSRMVGAVAAGDYRVFPSELEDLSEMSTEAISLKWLNGITHASEELAHDFPEYVGMTVFGSTVRGEANPKSDVDLNVMFEASDTDGIYKEVDEGGAYRAYRFDLMKNVAYSVKIKEHLRQQGINDVEDFIYPVNNKIVDESLSDLLEGAQVYDDSKGQDKKVWVARNLRGLFNAPIPSGELGNAADERMHKYQRQVVKQLSQQPHGETAWKMLYTSTSVFEAGRAKVNEAKAAGNSQAVSVDHRRMMLQPLPATLQEAVERYAPDIAPE